MIHLSTIPVEDRSKNHTDWKTLLSQSRMTSAELLARVSLPNHPLASADAESLFELRVPQPFLEKIEAGNPLDPLLLQVLPQRRETLEHGDFVPDPLNEANYTPETGLIHKYHNRVLLVTSPTCAINCRYCFRRSFPYAEHRMAKSQWQKPLEYITQHPELDEVILSGGDPMTLNNDYLSYLLTALDSIPHIKRIRIHSRMISALPQRVDGGLIALLASLSTKLVVVYHCNHPNELGEDVASAALKLKQANAVLFNQAVLLKGINDDADTLAQLSKRLFEIGILPYYLFTLDKVKGASHFDLPLDKARKIYRELLARLPGYLLPKLATELPGKQSKSPVDLYIE